jgi:hypothetical protein
MKKAYCQIIAVLVIGFIYAAQLAAQGVVGTLRIQGTLKNNNGQPVADGGYALTFKIYTSEAGGTAIWTETQPAINLTGGVYSAVLGSVSPLTPAFDVPYWLGVTIGSGAELQPRTALTAAPYALALLGAPAAQIGAVKSSYQSADHAGWVRLDGRAKTALSATQQTRATALGIGANLPSDDGRILAGLNTGQTLGQTTGAGTITIAQNNLPNATLTTATGGGAHTHAVSATLSYSGVTFAGDLLDSRVYYLSSGVAATSNFSLTASITTDGAHTHTFPLNGNVTQQPVAVPVPSAIALNFFVYLGL